jgi:hypothetical protein
MRVSRPLPMLAVPAAPFDSSEYSFEVKWDGVRALAAVETAGWRLWGRERASGHSPERGRSSWPGYRRKSRTDKMLLRVFAGRCW